MMSPDDLASKQDPDRLTMMSYLFHIYEYFVTKNDTLPPNGNGLRLMWFRALQNVGGISVFCVASHSIIYRFKYFSLYHLILSIECAFAISGLFLSTCMLCINTHTWIWVKYGDRVLGIRTVGDWVYCWLGMYSETQSFILVSTSYYLLFSPTY